eukprot:4115466-Amphidinium_carterae.1
MMSAPRSTFLVSTSCTDKYSPALAKKKKPKSRAAHSTTLLVRSPVPSAPHPFRRECTHDNMAVVTPSFRAGAGDALFMLSSNAHRRVFFANGSGAPARR